jgi:hypothetical protein
VQYELNKIPVPAASCYFPAAVRTKLLKSGLLPKPVELDGIKIRVVELLPYAEEFDSVPVPETVSRKIMA